MGRRKQEVSETGSSLRESRYKTPARSPEERENRMIALAMDAVEERIRNGTASSAELCHFLKLGSSREKLEQQDKRKDIELKAAKTESLESTKHIEELYANAVSAMQKYSGQRSPDD